MATTTPGGSSNKWKLQDLQDLEQYGLAAELESTRLGGRQGEAMMMSDGALPNIDIGTYDMSEALTELMTENGELFSESLLGLGPTSPPPLVSTRPQVVCALLRAPTAHCIKNTQEEITYLQKGHSYELHVTHMGGEQAAEVMFESVLLLTFSELRLRNTEDEQFEQWTSDHPMERLLEMDNIGCGGVVNIENAEGSLHCVTFSWTSRRTAIVAFKVNCLSSEFAARRHGGEKGIPLCLQLDTYALGDVKGSGEKTEPGEKKLVERLACNIKVFKDKGAERKQRQEQSKMEKLPLQEQANYRKSQSITTLRPMEFSDDTAMNVSQQTTPTSLHQSAAGCSPFDGATPTVSHVLDEMPQSPKLDLCTTVDHARAWLTANRFGQFLSLFANYTCQDLLRLSRRDLVDLCGPADGIRLYNALRSHTIKVIYIAMGTEKYCQAICLEHLTAQELSAKVAEKLSISPQAISSLLRLTSSGILVLVDDTVIYNIRDEECFSVQAIKQEDGHYQVVLQDYTPSDQSQISIRGAEYRH